MVRAYSAFFFVAQCCLYDSFRHSLCIHFAGMAALAILVVLAVLTMVSSVFFFVWICQSVASGSLYSNVAGRPEGPIYTYIDLYMYVLGMMSEMSSDATECNLREEW